MILGQKTPFFHISVDDVFLPLWQASQDRGGIGDIPFFSFLDDLNREFGVPVDLYVFYRNTAGGRTYQLCDIPNSARKDLEARRWLRWGPHGLDYETPPYVQDIGNLDVTVGNIYRELDRLTGAGGRSRWVRLHYFSECADATGLFGEHGIEALFLTDKDALCYHLPDSCRETLSRDGCIRHNDMLFIRSHFRLENLARDGITGKELRNFMTKILERHNFLVFFTHEVDLRDIKVRDTMIECLEHMYDLGIPAV